MTTNIRCVEHFDVRKLNYIINNIDTLFANLSSDKRKAILRHNTDYLNRSIDGIVHVEYFQKEVFGRPQGRYFAKHGLSLQNLKRCIRHTIAVDKVDIDFSNAHPVILLSVCKKHNIRCSVLASFINNREKFYNEIVGLEYDRSFAKKTYLSILNGGTKDYSIVMEKIKGRSLVSAFFNEMKNVRSKLSNLHQHEFEQIKKIKTANADGSLVNHLICEIENNVLMFVYKEIGSPLNCVLCFDGV
jgi:hypothetical protein